MKRNLAAFAILLCFLAARLSTAQNTDHASELAKRHGQYMDEPRIVDTGARLEISTNSPRPLDQVVGAVGARYGWHVNYEDPQYSASDLVDDTSPAWLQDHPNGRRVYVVGGKAFAVTIPLRNTEGPRDANRVLAAIVSTYNLTANPGRFELRTSSGGTFDVVPIAGDDKPILDTLMTFEATRSASADSTLKAFCTELGRRSGRPVQFWGFGGLASNLLMQTRIDIHAEDQPAREILRRMLVQVGRPIAWRVIYDPDLKAFIVELRGYTV